MIHTFFDEIADRVADRLEQRLLRTQARMIAQTNSELGARRHRAAVKRRLASGEGGAAIVGRKHLLTPEALREELSRRPPGPSCGERVPSKSPSKPPKSGTAARDLNNFERDLMRGLQEIE